METIGERIKKRRLELGLTQTQLAERLGYKNKTSITKIEQGENRLTQPKIKAIADALETTPSYIMGWNGNKSQVPQRLLDKLERFDAAELQKVEEMVDILLDLQKKEGTTSKMA